jgi:branched-chain amino acid transport system substrate-binding protein
MADEVLGLAPTDCDPRNIEARGLTRRSIRNPAFDAGHNGVGRHPMKTGSRRSRPGVVRIGVIAVGAALAIAACGSSGSSTSASGTSQSTSISASGSSNAHTPIVIGNVGQYSGYSSDVVLSTKYALEAWAQTVNASGGISGHPIVLDVEDDQTDASKSALAVKKLVETDHVVALVGSHDSGLESVWAKYVDTRQVPEVGGDAVGVPYSTDPNFFPITNTGGTGAFAYYDVAKLLKKTSASLVYCAELPACAQATSLAKTYTAQFGLTYLPGLPVSGSATSYTAPCLKLKSSGAQAVLIGTGLDTAGRLIANCTTDNYHPQWIINPLAWKPAQSSNPSYEGTILASGAPLWFGNGPGTSDFLTAMQKYQPQAILNSGATVGWYAGKLFEAAITKALQDGATGPITSKTVYDGLYALGPNFDLGGTVSPVTYVKGKPAAQQMCAWYAQIKDGQQTAPFGAGRVCAR